MESKIKENRFKKMMKSDDFKQKLYEWQWAYQKYLKVF